MGMRVLTEWEWLTELGLNRNGDVDVVQWYILHEHARVGYESLQLLLE